MADHSLELFPTRRSRMASEVIKQIAGSIAQELREHPERFTQCAFARDATGEPCDVNSPDAVCWCFAGLIAKRHNRWPPERYARAFGFRGTWDLITWSDDEARTVVGIIARCEVLSNG